jgi:hypothetical protein
MGFDAISETWLILSRRVDLAFCTLEFLQPGKGAASEISLHESSFSHPCRKLGFEKDHLND